MITKRKADHLVNSANHRPLKKARPENGNNSSNTGTSHQDGPALPELLPEYESIVFTHASIAVQPPGSTKMVNYERLEFLGDAQIEHIASLVLWQRFPSANPKRLSSMRESLVRNETLHKFAKMYHFDNRLQSTGSNHGHDREWQKIYADVFEAYVAAIILSDPDYHRGFKTAKTWLMELWEPMLTQLAVTTMNPRLNDNKSKEVLSKTILLPGVKLNYVEEKPPLFNKKTGESTFFIGVYLDGLGFDNQYLGSGTGDSKGIAGQEAARNALENPLMSEITQKRTKLLEQKKLEEHGSLDDPNKKFRRRKPSVPSTAPAGERVSETSIEKEI